ncbi:MAG: nucleotide exchange factor GrpE [Gemmatimonadales bacterium]|nr:MAG: nucleotide exchange factor GrpE [Gemmatimonadales bacterium]
MKDSDRDIHHDHDSSGEIVQEPRERGAGRADPEDGAGEPAHRVPDDMAAGEGEPSDDHDLHGGAGRPELAELAELRDRHLRLGAEFENYRKRTREEMGSSTTRAKAALIGSLLDVFDDFERMHQVNPETSTAQSVLEGIALVDRKLHRVLADVGLEIIDPAGEFFDPEVMEAVVRVPTEDPEEDDLVDQVLQRGAIFKGHLVRPARVAVRKVD